MDTIKSFFSGRRSISVVFITLLVMLSGCTHFSMMDDDSKQPISPEFMSGKRAVFTQGKEQFDIAVAPGQLGVYLSDDGAKKIKTAIQAIEAYGLTFAAKYGEQLLVFNAPNANSNRQISLLGQSLKSAESRLIAATGFVIWFKHGKSPLIVPNEIIVQFKAGTSKANREQIFAHYRLKLIQVNQFSKDEYLLKIDTAARLDVLETANQLNESELVEFSHPNFYREVIERITIPNDTYFGNQWHLNNTGQGGGTVDADIDAAEAWDFSLGNLNATPLVAVLDSGFDATHPDITPNLWNNPGEVAGDGIDNDGNGLIDDIIGWNFNGNNANLAGGNHGTAVAGSVAASGNNALGVSGSCPNCLVMLVRRGGGVFNDGQAFGYAQQMGADIITNSWGYAIGTPATANVVNAINNAATNGRGGLGSVVLFAMNNPNVNDCGASPDISSIANVIAVSRSTNQDQFDFSGFGDCMDVLSTSTTGTQPVPARGTLQGMTTDVQGAAGYNTGAGTACLSGNDPTSPPANALDYTYCFDGTSFATPVAAGIAGLILSLDTTPTRLQIQRLLQDTADKTEDSLAAYDTELGFSNAGAAATPATHGFGRVNAFEAVRIAAPSTDNGRGGVDIFVRDNRLDWGNTEQPSNVVFEPTRGFLGHWRSVDIKIDAPPYQIPPTNAADFAAFVDEAPRVSENNRVYVRVRNRGFRNANNVNVKLLWTQFGTALPNFPDATIWTDFSSFTGAVGDWTQVGVESQASLGYSGVSVANSINDFAGIFRFDNFSPTFDATKPNHFCLYAVTSSDEDPVTVTTLVPDQATPNDNNVTHRNVQVDESSLRDGRDESRFYVRNPFIDRVIMTMLKFEAPDGWKVRLSGDVAMNKPFQLKPGEARLVKIAIEAPKGASGDVAITQYRLLKKKIPIPLGGAIFTYKSEKQTLTERPLLWLEKYYAELFKKLGNAPGFEQPGGGVR